MCHTSLPPLSPPRRTESTPSARLRPCASPRGHKFRYTSLLPTSTPQRMIYTLSAFRTACASSIEISAPRPAWVGTRALPADMVETRAHSHSLRFALSLGYRFVKTQDLRFCLLTRPRTRRMVYTPSSVASGAPCLAKFLLRVLLSGCMHPFHRTTQ